MKDSVFLASTSLLGLLAASSAYATDLPVKYQESQRLPWAGLYFGANAGYAWSADPRTDCTSTSFCPTAPFPPVNASGAEFGAQVGYNWQVANWVFGVETDINKLGVKGNTQFAGIDPSKGPDQLSSRYDWLGTARGRAGVTNGNALLYATGGLAYGRVSHTYNYDPTNVGGANQMFATASTNVGWTAGGGLEYALGRNWSVKAEYLYVHLAASSLSLPAVSTTSSRINTAVNFNNNLNIVRVGANYHF